MEENHNKSDDFYAILGLKKECSAAELRNAYKNLAMRWHPDRFSASGNSSYTEEAKKKFQAIQQAYSVLSDTNKRFLYDVGVYDCNDDEDEKGMGDFLNEMATMMTQTKSNENKEESLEELQELFDELFQGDFDTFGSSSSSSASSAPYREACTAEMGLRNQRDEASSQFQGFCMGAGGQQRGSRERRKGRRQ